MLHKNGFYEPTESNTVLIRLNYHHFADFGVCVCVCVFVLRPLLFPNIEGRARALSSACKTDQDDFTDMVSFLTSYLIEEISPNTQALSANT